MSSIRSVVDRAKGKRSRLAANTWRTFLRPNGRRGWMSRTEVGIYELTSEPGGDSIVVEWEPPGGGTGTVYLGRFRGLADAKAHVRAHRKQMVGATISRVSV